MAKKPTKTKVEVAVKATSTSSGYKVTFGKNVKLGGKVNANSK
jgi:hypothetical protein|tara:strand:- start:16 stop:144 length:129 start_codon:yes stop_codon:yes gene_type:complete